MKSIKEVCIAELPAKKIEAITLYNIIRMAVKKNTLPWNLPENNSDVPMLQSVYDNLIEKQTETIMEVIINEIYL